MKTSTTTRFLRVRETGLSEQELESSSEASAPTIVEVVEEKPVAETVPPIKLLVAVPLPNKFSVGKTWFYEKQGREAIVEAVGDLIYELQTFPSDFSGYDGTFDAHTQIAKAAKDYDYVWFVDSGVLPPKDSLKILLGDDADIAYGLVPFHDEQEMVTAGNMWVEDGKLRFKASLRADLEGMVHTGYIWSGSGCMLVKSRVFETLGFRADREEWYGDDILFCNDAHKADLKTVVDGRVVCEHLPKLRD